MPSILIENYTGSISLLIISGNNFFFSLNNGTVQLETEKVTKLILKDAKASCSDELKADSEALFIDPITRNGYTIQKIRERNSARNPIIFKVD